MIFPFNAVLSLQHTRFPLSFINQHPRAHDTYLSTYSKRNPAYSVMCCTVIFKYRCGCAERVVFECPFSSTTNSILDERRDTDSHQNCSRHYRRHQEKLFAPEKTTATTTASPSHQALPQSLQIMIPILPPSGLPCSKPEKTSEQKISETKTSELDDICHDCWQRSLRLAKQEDDDGVASSATMTDDKEEVEHIANSRILRERSVNEFILPQPTTDSALVSSSESFSAG
jgi:hypothetical protein